MIILNKQIITYKLIHWKLDNIVSTEFKEVKEKLFILSLNLQKKLFLLVLKSQ